jgi:hypothetical protein
LISRMSKRRPVLASSALSRYACPEPKENFSTVSETVDFPRWESRVVVNFYPFKENVGVYRRKKDS